MGTGTGTGRGVRFLVAAGLAVGRDRNLPGAEHGPTICYHPIVLSSRRANMFVSVVVLMFCVVGAEMFCVCGARVFVFCAGVFHAVAFICLVMRVAHGWCRFCYSCAVCKCVFFVQCKRCMRGQEVSFG